MTTPDHSNCVDWRLTTLGMVAVAGVGGVGGYFAGAAATLQQVHQTASTAPVAPPKTTSLRVDGCAFNTVEGTIRDNGSYECRITDGDIVITAHGIYRVPDGEQHAKGPKA